MKLDYWTGEPKDGVCTCNDPRRADYREPEEPKDDVVKEESEEAAKQAEESMGATGGPTQNSTADDDFVFSIMVVGGAANLTYGEMVDLQFALMNDSSFEDSGIVSDVTSGLDGSTAEQVGFKQKKRLHVISVTCLLCNVRICHDVVSLIHCLFNDYSEIIK